MASWREFRARRDALFRAHPQSALSETQKHSFDGLRHYDYDPAFRFLLPVDTVANDKYFVPGKPGLSKLTFIFFKDQVAGVDALRSGQIDLTTRMPSSLFPTLQSEPNLRALSIPTNGFDLVRLRADQKPGDDPRVIKALKLATDRKAVFGSVELGQGAVGRDSPIGPLFTAYYTEDTEIPAADPEAARKLLAEAGYPNGIKLDLHVPDSGDRPDLAVVLKEQWAKAVSRLTRLCSPRASTCTPQFERLSTCSIQCAKADLKAHIFDLISVGIDI